MFDESDMNKIFFKIIVTAFLIFTAFSAFGMGNYSKINNENNKKSAMLFVSLGMPKLALRQYLIQSKKLGIPLIIRGLLQNSYPVTAKRIYQILHPKNIFQKPISGGFEIDPVYFRKFHVLVVPALVVTSGKKNSIVYGNIPILKLLTLIASNSKNTVIQKAAKSYLPHSAEYSNYSGGINE